LTKAVTDLRGTYRCAAENPLTCGRTEGVRIHVTVEKESQRDGMRDLLRILFGIPLGVDLHAN
jgi:hypothetical protein